MVTYEQAIRCPRCGKVGYALAALESSLTGQRQVTCRCADKTCAFYGRTWYLVLDHTNRVHSHTHTPYQEETATHD